MQMTSEESMDTAKTRKAWARSALKKQRSIGMMMTSLLPTRKVSLGLNVELNISGEHVVTYVDPGSPAEWAEISVGSVVLAVDGESIAGMSDAELRDLTSHHEETKLKITLRLPGSHDNRVAVDRTVYFRHSEAHSHKTPFFSKNIFRLLDENVLGIMKEDDDTGALIETDVNDNGFIGLAISPHKPHHVTKVYDLMDENGCKQGQPGYSNVAVHPEDVLLMVDGIDIEYKPIKEIHALIGGRVHSVVELTLERRSTGQIYTVRSKRHKKHERDEVISDQNLETPRLSQKKLLHVDSGSPSTPTDPQNNAFMGIELSQDRPYRVISAEDLVDEVHLKQGQRGYSNPDVQPGDELLQVDGYNVQEFTPFDLHDVLRGDLGSVAVMIFHRDSIEKQFVVRAVRHKSHDLEKQGSRWFQITPSPSLTLSERQGSKNHEADQCQRDKIVHERIKPVTQEDPRNPAEIGSYDLKVPLKYQMERRQHRDTAMQNQINMDEQGIVHQETNQTHEPHWDTKSTNQLKPSKLPYSHSNMVLMPVSTLLEYAGPEKWSINAMLDPGALKMNWSAKENTANDSNRCFLPKKRALDAPYTGHPGNSAYSTGIGCVLTHLSDGRIIVQEVKVGGGAYHAAVQPGSRLLSVDGNDVSDKSIATIRKWCTGLEGSMTILEVQPPGAGKVCAENVRPERKTVYRTVLDASTRRCSLPPSAGPPLSHQMRQPADKSIFPSHAVDSGRHTIEIRESADLDSFRSMGVLSSSDQNSSLASNRGSAQQLQRKVSSPKSAMGVQLSLRSRAYAILQQNMQTRQHAELGMIANERCGKWRVRSIPATDRNNVQMCTRPQSSESSLSKIPCPKCYIDSLCKNDNQKVESLTSDRHSLDKNLKELQAMISYLESM